MSNPSLQQKQAAYLAFLRTKIPHAELAGIEPPCHHHASLKPHQVDICQWAIRGGRRAIFAQFGLGKSRINLQLAAWVVMHCASQGKSGLAAKFLIVAPLGVRHQFTLEDGPAMGLMVDYVRNLAEAEASPCAILITNYERVRDGDLDPQLFAGASLDEASVLRSYGSLTYQSFLDKFAGVPFRYVFTATPSPNRYKELIHYAGFLGVMDTGEALAQPLDAKVLTPQGWKTMGEIKIADQIISCDGTAANVIGVYPQGEKEIYRITFSDGSVTECTEDHIWLTRTQYQRNAATKFSQRNPYSDASHYWSVKNTAEIKASLTCTSTGSKNHQIPLVSAVQFEDQPITIDPWLLGALLGDGHLRQTSVNLTTADDWIAQRANAEATKYGLILRKSPHTRADGKQNYDYCISNGNGKGTGGGRGHESNQILKDLRDLDLLEKRSWDKRVPRHYLFNSIEVRLSVLQGLMDTDGTISADGRNLRFISCCKGLAEDVQFIVQSLGGTAKISERKVTGSHGKIMERTVERKRPLFLVAILLPENFIPFSLPRKVEKIQKKTKYFATRYIAGIEKIGLKQAQCIAVDHPSRLYLTDDFIVTHNTRFFARDSSQANNLTIYPHMEQTFWRWMMSWAVFIQSPADLGHDATGYDLPPVTVHWHRMEIDHAANWTAEGNHFDGWGQGQMFVDPSAGLKQAAEVKRNSVDIRLEKAVELMAAEPDEHWLLWHDLEAERRAIEKGTDAVTVWGSMDLELREERIQDFSHGRIKTLATKPSLAGSGCNFQHHCARAIFMGIGYKFNDIIQAWHRIVRFLQGREVHIHFIYLDTEDLIKQELESKWRRHNELVATMTELLKKHKLAPDDADILARTIGVAREERRAA